ncbi:Membrane protein insertase YidC [Planctomycetales bacterium 10988]|nr:Membrane protein insertase YidC [Planctomycetales bacterium 10988]
MEKRFVVFIVVSLAITLGYGALMRWLQPPQPQQPPAGQEVVQGEDQAEEEEPQDEPAADPEDPAVEEQPEAEQPEENEENSEEVPAEDEADNEETKQTWLTLGSLDPASPYRLLVTLTSRGAAIENAELVNPRYQDLEDRTGYLGLLQPLPHPQGIEIQVVGPGTPAAKAGLQAGDIITRWDGSTIPSVAYFRAALKETEPEDKIELVYLRGETETTTSVEMTQHPLQVLSTEPGSKSSLLLTLEQVGDQILSREARQLIGADLYGRHWELVEDETNQEQATFQIDVPKYEVRVTKRFVLSQIKGKGTTKEEQASGYKVKLEVELENLKDETRLLSYRLDGPTGLPTEGSWYAIKIWGGGVRDVVVRFADQSPQLVNCATIAQGEQTEAWQGTPLEWIGVDAQYFAAILIPDHEDTGKPFLERSQAILAGPPREFERLSDTTVRVVPLSRPVAGNQSISDSYNLFVGPKDPEILSTYDLGSLLNYGWFAPIVNLLLWFLHFLNGYIGNYGLAIILMTICVRLLMHPLTRYQTMQMQKMQATQKKIQPQLKRLQDKYKNDPAALQQAQMALYREHNVINFGCLSGCMVVLLQMPIFFALFTALRGDIQLRQASLFGEGIRWCSNLAAPDMLFYWEPYMPEFLTAPDGWISLGPYFNLLPLLSSILLWSQQRRMMTQMAPAADEKQAEMQQAQKQVMTMMTLFMGVLFFKFPAGLCLYFLTSTLWGMGERNLLPKPDPEELEDPKEVKTPGKTPATSNEPAKPGLIGQLLKKVEDIQNEQAKVKRAPGEKSRNKKRKKGK